MGQLIRPDCADEILPPEPKWRRNGYWLPITTPTDSEEKAVILKAVFDSTQEWTALSAEGDYTVDWGDGNIENFASGVTAEHTYNYADVDLHDSSAALGYKQAIIQVYPQTGQHLTFLNLCVRHSSFNTSLNSGINSGFLDIVIAGIYLIDVRFSSSDFTATGNVVQHYQCERFRLNSLIKLNNFSYFFSNCFNLQSAYVNTESCASAVGFFNGCAQLKNITFPLNFSLCTDLTATFAACLVLESIPNIDTSSCQNFSSTFNSCRRIKTIPNIDTSSATNMASMFMSCRALIKLPMLTSDLVTNFSNCLSGCANLKNWPFTSLDSATNLSNFATSSSALPKFPSHYLNNISNVTDLSAAFASESPLLTFPSTTLITNTVNIMFGNARYLVFVGSLNLPNSINFANLFINCLSLKKTGIITATAGTNFTSMYSGCNNLEYSILQGCRYTVSIANCKFPKENIEAFLAALGSAAAGTQTITISGNPGTGTIYSKTATTTAGSKIVTMADTSNLAVGDRMTGTGSPLTTAIAVTFTDAGDLVNLNNHQLLDGDLVSFVSITTTTGIAVRTPYYVVNKTADNFQLALTAGGAAITLTNNGSGTMIYDAVVDSIDTNVSVTLSRPATSSSTSSKSFRELNTAPALLRGFAISG